MSKYKCPYCDYETGHLLVYLLHLDKHKEEKERDARAG